MTALAASPLRAWYRRQWVLVTGASGVIGTVLLEQLAGLGPVVTVGFARRPADAGTTAAWQVGDLRDERALRAAIAGASLVFHLAAAKRPGQDDLSTVNVDGTSALLRACELERPAVIFASTACVYAASERARTEDAAVGPTGPYAESKLAAEALVRGYAQRFAAPALIARLSNVYGGRIEADTVVGTAMRQAGQPVLRLRDLRPVRDFIHVRDVAEALLRLAPLAAATCPIVNVGTGVARVVVEAAGGDGARPTIQGLCTGPCAPDTLVLDSGRLRALTGWAPAITLRAGIADVLQRARAAQIVPAP
jgi:nucleoside-diphosphate-sugar epimerase